MARLHIEKHNMSRVGWLRTAVLGANDGIVSTASIIVGVAAASANTNDVLLAGTAGLVAVSTVLGLAILGALGAKAGGASIIRGAGRVMLWGVLAMAATVLVGSVFNVMI